MQTCDVLIVGGGPAGSSCAWRLRSRGLDVVVLDQAQFPRDKVCAGWVTPQVLDSLHLDLVDYARDRVLQPISGFRTGLIQRRMLETRYPEVVSYAIRRCQFDDYLLRRSGARLRLGEALRSLERTPDGWIANADLRAAMLVGAGGHRCPVAHRLADKPERRVALVLAQEAEFSLPADRPCGVRGETPELYFCRDLKGYGWCVRKGDWFNIGMGREDQYGLKARLDDFCLSLYRAGHIPRPPPGSFKGHAYLLHGHGSRPLIADHALLIGDAAGLAYARSGEGIRPAVESGLIAADVIAECRADYRADSLQAYPARLHQRLGPPRRAAEWPSPWLAQRLGEVLLGNSRLTRNLLLERWFLHSSTPALETEAEPGDGRLAC